MATGLEGNMMDYHLDMVKLFRHSIPCSCLEKKYEEVKTITKLGSCYSPHCKFPNGITERSPKCNLLLP